MEDTPDNTPAPAVRRSAWLLALAGLAIAPAAAAQAAAPPAAIAQASPAAAGSATGPAGGAGPAAVAPAAASSLASAEAPPVVAVPLHPGERIPLDGTLAHPAWQRAPVHAQFVEKFPDTGGRPGHATRVRVLYDNLALYVGIEAIDPQPAAIRDLPVVHDGVNRTQDFVVVYVDAIGSRQSAQFFRVNAAGSTADGMHTAADDSEDFAPDFDFDAATARNAQGWTAVLRIPFASLRYAEGGAPGAAQPWRFMVGRRVPRQQFYLHTSVLIPREAPSFIATLQPLQGVQLPAAHQFLTVRPSLTLRQQRLRAPGQPADSRSDIDATLDLKWRPRAELVIDATLNPDFSQVELDVPQLTGNTGFALALPEKRPFFFEGSDLLRSPTEALYTRSLTQPRWGLRGTWRGAGWAGTALAVDDRGGGLVLLPEAFGTGALAQPANRGLVLRAHGLDGRLQWGALAALRRYQGGGHNQVAGPDLAWQIDDAWRLRAQWLGSDTTARPDAAGLRLVEGPARRGHQAHLKLNMQQQDRHEAELAIDDVSAGFRNDSGFTPQAGVRKLFARWARGRGATGPLNELWFNLKAEQVRTLDGGELVSRSLAPGLWMTGPHNLEASVYLHGLVADASVQRSGSGRPLQRQHYLDGELVFTPAPWAPLLSAKLKLGRLADLAGDRPLPGGRFSLNLTTRPLRWLELQPHLEQAWLREDGRSVYTESGHQLLARWYISPRQTLRGIVQYAAQDRDGIRLSQSQATSLTWTWRLATGTVLYVGAARNRDGTGLPVRQSEAFVKMQVDADTLRQWW